MKRTAIIAFVLVYVVVLAGSVVRMTGSGMGCPDWPMCFGHMIPPTSEDQIRWHPETDYSEGQMVIERDTLWRATVAHNSSKSMDLKSKWAPYTRHSYAKFNAAHTWTEFLNRLSGALSGIPVILLLFLAFRSRRKIPIILASGTFISLVFVAWLGKLVVDGNLIPFSITIHMIGAISILLFLVGFIHHLDGRKTTIHKSYKRLLIASLTLAFLQLILGTQVREAVDIALESGVSRLNLVSALPSWWIFHRSAYWILIAVHAMWAIPLLKISQLSNYAKLTFAIILGQTITGIAFSQLGMPAIAQPIHLILGFGLVLIDFRTLLAVKS